MIGEITESNYKEKEAALEYLLKGQCNCPYWHGTFGGLYLNNLRHETYANLIRATEISLEKVYGRKYFLNHNLDFDMDGREEIIISSRREAFLFHTLSGSIIEWDLKTENPINLIDCLKRREEAYHIAAMRNANNNQNDNEHVSIHEIAKKVDENIAKYLVFDKNEKVFAVDHFLNKLPTAEEFQLLKYEENASFYESYYNVIENIINKDYASVSFEKTSKKLCERLTAADHLKKRIPEIIDHYVKAWNGEYDLTVFHTPCTYSDEELCKELVPAIGDITGADRIRQIPAMTGTEDFGYVTKEVPGMFVFVGAGAPGNAPLHSPKMVLDEDVLPLGAAIYANTAVQWLEKHGDIQKGGWENE